MKLKIVKGSPLFDALHELWGRMKECNKAADDLVRELGYKEKAINGRRLAGGIDAIEMEGPKPEGWKKVGDRWQSFYYPTAKNKEVLRRIQALPTMDNDELNKILNFHSGAKCVGDSLVWISRPGMSFSDDYMLMELSEGHEYKIPEGAEEILESEYLKLKEAIPEEE